MPSGFRDGAATDLVFALAGFFERRGHIDDWITLATAAAEIHEEAEDLPHQAMALVTLGLAYVRARRFDEAIGTMPFAAAVFQVIGDRRSQAAALILYGLALWEKRRFDEALTALSTAVRFHSEAGDHHGLAGALTSLGLVLTEGGRFMEAITLPTSATSTWRRRASTRRSPHTHPRSRPTGTPEIGRARRTHGTTSD